ncbi:uncharacterized protein METZ01_LOCUS357730 [marine metagenome]|uniref:Uncharacterized protein n=1 Tax=marine metagenome TaxID=408172 RepID=A0A382S4Q9_9ZZZZ
MITSVDSPFIPSINARANVAIIEPRETKRVTTTVPIKHKKATKVEVGETTAKAPPAVETPLPP